jgi:peptidoglycan/LPS O-acetylase OafA/YrhL
VKDDSPNLDFLRSFAVLLVVGGHLSHFFGVDRLGPFDLIPLGTLGVLYFFVHTCLVLMLSLERQRASQGNNRLFAPFMIRRCFRLYPLSMATVLVIVAFGLPMAELHPGTFVQWRADLGDIFANLFLVQNLSYRVSILGPLWSLCYEMEMYLFLPLLFVWAGVKRIWWSIPAIWVAAVALNWFFTFSTPNLLIYVPCFLPGIMAFLFQKRVRPRIPAWCWPLFVTALSLAFCVSQPSFYRRYLTCLILGLAIPLFHPTERQWLRTPCNIIARYSYGIYLSHFACIWLAFQKLGSLPMLARVAIFVSTFTLIPVLLYRTIENPCVGLGKKVAAAFLTELSRTRRSLIKVPSVETSV